jgi:DNA-binding transcriptional regulator LsrR (DeoR family)
MAESGPYLDADIARPQSAERVPRVSELMARAARLRYEFGLTHQDTAEALGISRIKVVRVVAAAGPSKAEAIAAALRGVLVTVLVTDVEPARALIESF